MSDSTTARPPVDADAVAAAVAACDGVVRLSGGSAGDHVATFLPGRRVAGVRSDNDSVEVHIASRWELPIPAVAAEVRAALAPLVGGRAVTVVVDDVDEPPGALPAAGGSTAEAATLTSAGEPVAVPSPS